MKYEYGITIHTEYIEIKWFILPSRKELLFIVTASDKFEDTDGEYSGTIQYVNRCVYSSPIPCVIAVYGHCVNISSKCMSGKFQKNLDSYTGHGGFCVPWANRKTCNFVGFTWANDNMPVT